MHFIRRDGVLPAYDDIHSGRSLMLLVHGWGCDHRVFSAQAEFFGRSHRVVSVDLRGQGRSNSPHQDYTMDILADDLAWLCSETGLDKPVVIGHSMGGNVALEFAARHPDISASVVLIDSMILPRDLLMKALQPLLTAVESLNCIASCREVFLSQCLPGDDETRKARLVGSLPKAPRYVLSALTNSLPQYDSTVAPAAAGRPLRISDRLSRRLI